MERELDLYADAKRLCICTEILLDRLVEASGLTTSQTCLLLYIWQEHPSGACPTELHKELGLSKASVSGVVKRLRQKGFLTAEIQERDERYKVFTPTDKSKEVIEQLSAAIQEAENAVYGGLNQEERSVLLRLQRKALSRAEQFRRESSQTYQQEVFKSE